VDGAEYPADSWTNVTPTILSKIPLRLHLQPNHPLGIIRSLIEAQFPSFAYLNSLSPIVSTHQNFDELGFPSDHSGRSVTDTYYLNQSTLLRTHTSAHEIDTFRQGHEKWLLTADVYRRDEIDATHSPVFHQVEGARTFSVSQSEMEGLKEENETLRARLASTNIFIEDNTKISSTNPWQDTHHPAHAELVATNLKHHLNALIYRLFSFGRTDAEPLRVRWIEAYFPFTSPSYEVEVFFRGKWLEILGCGVVKQRTLDLAGAELLRRTRCNCPIYSLHRRS
jgi:phenylalanyl-tRNA synthetase alpha chain